MKFSKIKEGQRLVVKNQKQGLKVSPIGDEFIGQTCVVERLDESDNTAQCRFPNGDSLWVMPHWVEPADTTESDTFIIPREDMNRIYQIACSDWKQKLKSHFETSSPFEELFQITREFASLMISASTESQRPIVSEILKKAGYETTEDKYFDFGSSWQMSTTVNNNPLYIREGHATSGMGHKEIGFNEEFNTIIVIDGKEHSVSGRGCYIKFTKK